MDHYADEQEIKKHYHEKAKRVRAEARRLTREEEKARKTKIKQALRDNGRLRCSDLRQEIPQGPRIIVPKNTPG